MLGAQQTATLTAIVDDFCDDREVEYIKVGQQRGLYVWGIVSYEDVFGETHRTRYCQALTWMPDGKVYGYHIPGHHDAT